MKKKIFTPTEERALSERLYRLSEIADEFGDDLAARAARMAVRQADDGEPFLTFEELERLFADLRMERDPA